MQKHLLFFMTVLSLSFNLYAANWRSNPEFTSAHPCNKDLPKYCTDAPDVPTKKNHYRCLGENFSRISNSCRNFMITFWKPFPCSADIMKYCKGEDQNIGRSFNCIKGHAASVDPSCKNYIKKLDAMGTAAAERVKACAPFQKKFCANVRGKDLQACMKEHASDLSADCRAKIEKFQKLVE